MKTTKTDRREFLGRAGAVVLGTCLLPDNAFSAPRFFAVPAAEAFRRDPRPPTLVTIFLRGGNDALNTFVPYTNKTYYEVRPQISIPEKDTADEPGVIRLDDKVGMHPALKALKPFWDRKLLAPIVGVGSPHPTRSHFDAQDFMEYAAPGDRTLKQGWLNRFLEATSTQAENPLRALAMQGLLPRSLRGSKPVLAVPQLKQGDSEGLLDLFDDVYKKGEGMDPGAMGGAMEGGADRGRDEAVAVGRHTIETLRRFWEIIEKEPADAGAVEYPKHPTAQRLSLVAKCIKNGAGLQVAALDLGGWDHHQGEGASDGAIQRDLTTLGDALGAFATDLGPALDRVMVLVMTEFGRTVAENGNRGTDHGRGSMMIALGGPVNGGKVYGDYGSLEPKNLADGRDLRVDLDYRAVFNETLLNLFDFKAPKGFFPLWTPAKDPLGFVKKV